MPSKLRRITFVVSEDMEEKLDEAKKVYYDKTRSEMIRLLVLAGLESLHIAPGAQERQDHGCT